MTTHFIDVRILPNPEISTAHLMNALLEKLHRALVKANTGGVGISFPDYNLPRRSLGAVIRLHGSAAELQALQLAEALGPMADHVRVGTSAAAPAGAPRIVVTRRQVKSNAERLRRRRARRHSESLEASREAIPTAIERHAALPAAFLRSGSTGQRHPVLIEQREVAANADPTTTGFTSYGLSATASVPWF